MRLCPSAPQNPQMAPHLIQKKILGPCKSWEDLMQPGLLPYSPAPTPSLSDAPLAIFPRQHTFSHLLGASAHAVPSGSISSLWMCSKPFSLTLFRSLLTYRLSKEAFPGPSKRVTASPYPLLVPSLCPYPTPLPDATGKLQPWGVCLSPPVCRRTCLVRCCSLAPRQGPACDTGGSRPVTPVQLLNGREQLLP